MKLVIGSDHGGLHLKAHVKAHLEGKGCEVLDVGTYTEESCDYPDIAALVAAELAAGHAEKGILVCGTGIGMSIAANKCAGIRAAVVTDEYSAGKASEHNNANVLCLGERVLGPDLATNCVDAWLATPFAGGRHERRVAKIMALAER